MILSAHQPAYLPWLGYFEKIARADIFVFLDTVQYEKNSFINRNRIKGPNGPIWLTVPVKGKNHLSSSLRTTVIDNSKDWRRKHLKNIQMNYAKAPNSDIKLKAISKVILSPEENLSNYCFEQLKFWLSELSIDTPVVRSSTLDVSGIKSELVLNLCKHFGAEKYLSGSLGRDYIVEEDFRSSGISVEYQAYKEVPYSQLWGQFTPNLSVVDLWMNSKDISSQWGGRL